MAGDVIIVHGGVYRECIRPTHSGAIDLPIIYRAANGESPVVKASDVWHTVWKSESDNLYSTPYDHLPWDKPNRFRPNIPENRCEQIFIDGLMLKHVRNRDILSSKESSFWTNDPSKEIWIHYREDPNKCLVERSVREQCLMPLVRGLEHIQIKGFTFVGGAAHPWTGGKWHHVDQLAVVSVNAGRHWLIENNVIEWGNAQGLQLAVGGCFVEENKHIPIVHALDSFDFTYKAMDVSGYNTARNNKVRNNGISGIVGFVGVTNIIVEDNEVTGNCQKDFKGSCEECGMKFHVMVDSIIRRNVVSDNNAYGIWLDGLCKRNRITQNILVNNSAAPIFYELSDGPILIDNNVIIDTREKPVDVGIYNQDGNLSIVINNAIIGPELGTRIRALFHRQYEGGKTTTFDNLFYNNVVAECRKGCVSFMPEVARYTGNHSDHNIFWSDGGPVFCRVENTSDVGVPWESLPLGKAMGYSGEGIHAIKIDAWKEHYGEDQGSILVPYQILFDKKNSRSVLDTLTGVWRKRGLDLNGGFFEVYPLSATEWIRYANPKFEKYRLLNTMWIKPHSGIQIWETREGLKKILWNDMDVENEASITLSVPYIPWDKAVHIAAGDSCELDSDCAWKLLMDSVVEVTFHPGKIGIKTTEDATRGDYCIVLISDLAWTYIPVVVIDPYAIEDAGAKVSGVNKFLVVSVINRSCRDVPGRLFVDWLDKKVCVESIFPSNRVSKIEAPVNITGDENIHIQVILPKTRLNFWKQISFAEAHKAESWKDVKRYEIKEIIPSSLASQIKEEKRASAGWRVRYTDEGIYFRVEVEHKIHSSIKTGMDDLEGIHCGDCVKICLKGNRGDKATIIGLTLRSDTGEQVYGFNKTVNEKRYPVGRSSELKAFVAKRSSRMIYDVLVTWDMINLFQPVPGMVLPMSILICKDDKDIKYEMQWFGGIRYDESEGKESAMGQLWLN
jgi:hypothetical protein